MSLLQKSLLGALSLLLLVVLTAWVKLGAEPEAPAEDSRTAAQQSSEPVDASAFQTAQRLNTLATGSQEQRLAQSVLRLADHELDLTFVTALRQLDARPQPLSKAGEEAQARLQLMQRQLDAAQKTVTELSEALTQAAAKDKGALQDQLDVANAQAELAKFEVEEAGQELEDAGGNLRHRIEAQVQEHEAAEHASAAAPAGPVTPATTVVTLPESHGLLHEFQLWLALRQKTEALRHEAQAAAVGFGTAPGLAGTGSIASATKRRWFCGRGRQLGECRRLWLDVGRGGTE